MEPRRVAPRICVAVLTVCLALYIATATIGGTWSFWRYQWLWAVLAAALVAIAVWIALATVPAQYWTDRQTARGANGKELARQEEIIESQASSIATLEGQSAAFAERLGIVWVVPSTEVREKIIRSHGMRAELRTEGKYGVTREDSNDLLALMFRYGDGIVVDWNNGGNRGLAGPFADYVEALREISIELGKGDAEAAI